VGLSLEPLVAEYQFGFRSSGRAYRLSFDAREFVGEDKIDETVSDADLTRGFVERLAKKYRWLELVGGIRAPDVEQLVNFAILIYPTFEPERPACVVYRFDYSLLEAVRDVDSNALNQDAADRLFRLVISIGASRHTDGFRLDTVLENLVAEYTFGFRSVGRTHRLLFEREVFLRGTPSTSRSARRT
jgi:hypothetical protein